MAKRLNDYYIHQQGDEYEQQQIRSAAHEEDDYIRIKLKSETPAQRTWAFFRPIVIFVVSVLIVLGVVNYTVERVRGDYFDPVDVNDTQTRDITIKKGSSLSTISELLEEEGIVRSKQSFKLYVDFTDNTSKLKSGTYQLSPSMTFDEIIYNLRKGRNIDPTGTVMLLEGQVAEDYAHTLKEREILLDTEEYLKKCQTGDDVNITSTELKEIVNQNKTAPEKRKFALEGYLFPDTYNFYKDTDADTVIRRQLSRFYEIFQATDYTRALEMGMTVDNVVTLASIIEKEAQTHDFEKVSAVLHNRLDREMPLQCDSTMAYALDIDNRIVLNDYELQMGVEDESGISPYNTHQRAGLPLGPICNPSKAAINAALYPDEEYMDEGYLFFALMDPVPDEEGKLYLEFNKDIDAHNEAVERYRPLWEAYDRQQAREANSTNG